MKDFNLRSWPDIGDCVLAAADLNGTLILDVCENYADKGVVVSYAATGDESIKEKALADAIPEFLRFNIVESEVRNVC